jgi:hypothetical protein
MKCTAVRDLIFRKMDNELSDIQNSELDSHLAICASCSREYQILRLPRQVAQTLPPIEPSPFFYQKLRMNLEGEAQKAAGWYAVSTLARQVIPALAGITLALLSIFAYFQMNGREPDLYKAYNRVFISEDQPNRMLTSEQGEITDESVLRAIADRDFNHYRNLKIK